MSKYDIGQTLFWIKYLEHVPTYVSFEVGCIKKTKSGYKYAIEAPGASYIKESLCFPSLQEAVDAGCKALEGLLKEQEATQIL